MKVGIFYSGGVPEAGGGYTFELDVLTGFLAIAKESSHKFTILCFPSTAEVLQEKLGSFNIPVQPIHASWLRRSIVSLLHTSDSLRARINVRSWLDRAADEAKVDFIWILGKGPCLTERPYITVVWDVQHRVTPWFPELNSKTWDWREQTHNWFLRKAVTVITGTQRGREELEHFYQLPPERIAILPHPTPKFSLEAPPDIKSDIAKRANIGSPYLLYPAQFWPHKNHANLILAFDLLRSEKKLPLELVLVGSDKGNRAYIEQLVTERNLSLVVHFLGFISRDDLITLYRDAFALVYASWCGPENLPPLEAFALGCPVIATRIPGAEEQLGGAALLADPHDPTDIAGKVSELYANQQLRAQLINAGHHRARAWTAEDYVRGVFSLLDRFEPIGRSWRATPR